MRKKVGVVVLGLALAGGLSACANNYGIPPGGPHFSSWSHAKYSVRGGEKAHLTRAEFEQAQEEGWWGTPVPYNIDELE
ncbi:MAG: hypothetical protein ACE5G5_06455 [Candidatus Methylomirabilales bacterium]